MARYLQHVTIGYGLNVRPAIVADGFWNVSKDLQHLWRQAAPLEHHARNQLGFLVPYECIEAFVLTKLARITRHVTLPPRWASIEVPIGCIALLPPCISYLGIRLQNDANSGL